MDRELAQQVIRKIEVCIEELNNALFVAQGKCSEAEFMALRHGAGFTLSEIHDRMLGPIYSEHPDLLPAEVMQHFSPGRTLAELGAPYCK